MRAKPKRFSFNLHTWKTGVFVYTGTSYESFIKRAKQLGIVPKDAIIEIPIIPAAQCLRYPHTRLVGLWFSEAKPSGSIVAHEAFHAAAHILSTAGVDLNGATEEAYTYTMEHIIREIGKRVW